MDWLRLQRLVWLGNLSPMRFKPNYSQYLSITLGGKTITNPTAEQLMDSVNELRVEAFGGHHGLHLHTADVEHFRLFGRRPRG